VWPRRHSGTAAEKIHGERDILFEVIAGLARHMGQLERDGTRIEFPGIFETVEHIVTFGTRPARNLASIGLLEDLGNVRIVELDDPASHFWPWLGPVSQYWWRGLELQWARDDSYRWFYDEAERLAEGLRRR
jgi:hypothetical protein